MNYKNKDRESDSYLLDTLRYPFFAVREWFADALSGDDRIRDPDGGAVSTAISLLTLPFRLLFAFIVFMVQAWTTSRKGRAFLLGLPSVMTVAMCALLAWGATFYKGYNRIPLVRAKVFYSKQAKAEKPVPENLLMFAEKLHQLKPDDDEAKYNVGAALGGTGENAKAASLMRGLAPEDEVGYVPAHLWLARNYLGQQQSGQEDADVLASKHLELVAEEDPSNLQAQSLLASQYQIRAADAIKAGDEAGEKEHLKNAVAALEKIIEPVVDGRRKAVSSFQQLMQIPRLLNIKRQLGTAEGALQKYDPTFKKFVEETQAWPNKYRMQVFVAFRDSAISVKDYDRAVAVMQLAFQTFDDSKLKQAFIRESAKIMLLKADQHDDFDDREEYLAHLNALSKSFNTSPAEREAYLRLLEVIIQTGQSDKHQTWLNESLLDTPKLSLVHLLIGFNMISQGDIQDGRNHWKIAFRIEKVAQSILNNMIDVASSDKLGRVENMIDVNLIALEMFDQPMLYQSMGMNHVREESFKEAAENFEIALEQNPGLLRSHYHAVNCYKEIGNTEKAEFHQGKLDEYMAKLPPAQAERFLKILQGI